MHLPFGIVLYAYMLCKHSKMSLHVDRVFMAWQNENAARCSGWVEASQGRDFVVREFWVVDPAGRSIEVAAHNGKELATVQVYPPGTTLVSPTLVGFELQVDGVFR